MLLSFGAKVDEEDGKGKTIPIGSSDEMMKLLVEHGAVHQP